ncbi:MAG: NADH-quinone oxidoreductase subunit NuoH [Nitrospirota bacterium]|nr:NADH-quinone oxidoreductase subunit NuoH [Nitrospirota bacterium]
MEIGWMVITALLQITVVLITVLLTVAYMTYAERKVLSFMQDRLGPMEVGPYGLLQPIADGLKLFFKEDIIPAGANKIIFSIAPIICLIPALIGFAVIPYTEGFTLFGMQGGVIADLNVGLLYIFAFAGVGAYGVILGGWASNSKYALLGGLRSAAQIISYELAMGFSIVGVLLLSGSLSLVSITQAQSGTWFGFIPQWNVFLQPVAFGAYVIAAVAETNRLPFDMPEAESELVAGFFTEYSGMRFAFFFLAEYGNMILVSCLASVLFLGGYNAPLPFLSFIPGFAWLALKTWALLFFFIWIRGTFPRVRFDQLMKFGWKVLIPVTLVNLLVTALGVYIYNN